MLGVVLLALTPLINLVLRLDSLASAAVVGLIAVPLTVMGGQAGVLQGERRWALLAVVYVAAGVPRLLFGSALVLWQPSELAAMVGVLLGACVPVVVGLFALRRPRSEHADGEGPPIPSLLGEVARSSQALLAFFALSNVDVIVARNVLDGHDAGLYAAGLILTKAVLFLPQFVVVVTFPAMSTPRERRRTLVRALSLVGGIGAVAVAGALAALTARHGVRRRQRVLRDRVEAVAVRRARHGARDAPAPRVRRARASGPPVGLRALGRAGAGRRARARVRQPPVAARRGGRRRRLLLAVLLGISLYLARKPAPVED